MVDDWSDSDLTFGVSLKMGYDGKILLTNVYFQFNWLAQICGTVTA